MSIDFCLKLVASLVALLAACILLWVIKRRHQLGVFRWNGIPGPTPRLLSGNHAELKADQIKALSEWIQAYGKVFGFYHGDVPYVVLTDPDIIKECFVKEANVFRDRPPMPITVEPIKSSLLCLKGDEWKRVRGVLNGSFTAAKMKLMTPTMNSCARVMLDVLDQAAGTGQFADVTAMSQGYSMDVITKCALAWEVECQLKPQNPLLRQLEEIFSQMENSVAEVACSFPPLRALLELCFPFCAYGRLFKHITDNLAQVLQLRRKRARPVVTDLMQLMLDAQEKEALIAGEQKNTPALTDRHLVSNCFISLAAGYETTATTLAFVLYELARHPQEQDRVYEELTALPSECGLLSTNSSDQAGEDDDQELGYDQLHSLRRLDAIIYECLRLYPPIVSFIGRNCSQRTKVAGHEIPAGVNVLVPTWHVHHDPELWIEPFRFDPDRFYAAPSSRTCFEEQGSCSIPNSRTYHPATYVPFGLGPRECLGRRFALLELKTAVCKVVRRYRLALPDCEEFRRPIKVRTRAMMIHPVHNINLVVERRDLR